MSYLDVAIPLVITLLVRTVKNPRSAAARKLWAAVAALRDACEQFLSLVPAPSKAQSSAAHLHFRSQRRAVADLFGEDE